MTDETRELVTWLLGTMLAGSAVVGLGARFVLLPWLREHLVGPVQQVKKQVSENQHANQQPTVLDRIDDVQTELKALGKMFDGHLQWSERWVDLIEREMVVMRMEREHKE